MDIIDLHSYCINKLHSEESLPFGDNTLVFKVKGKMFALISLDEPENLSINLKCDPELAIELREQYACVIPGWHMNKKYWNTVIVDDSVSSQIIKSWIDHSYDETVKKLTKKLQQELTQNGVID